MRAVSWALLGLFTDIADICLFVEAVCTFVEAGNGMLLI